MQARRPPPGRTRTLALPLAWCLAPPCGLHSYSGRCPQPAGRKGSAAPRNECPRCTDGLAGGTGDVEAHAVIAVSRETRPPRACPARCSRNPHTSDRRAAQTSHGTYNKYREPLFHFGCKSTNMLGADGSSPDVRHQRCSPSRASCCATASLSRPPVDLPSDAGAATNETVSPPLAPAIVHTTPE